MGVGDCSCDRGMIELRLIYSGQQAVDITISDKNGNAMFRPKEIEMGDEVICNVANYDNFDKFSSDTNVQVFDAVTGSEICVQSIHTSCSNDIVGTHGEGSCGETLIVSGWKDGADDINDCDDGINLCGMYHTFL